MGIRAQAIAGLPLALLLCRTPACAAGPTRGGFSITAVAGLRFGPFVAGSGGAVTVTPAGARLSDGGVHLLPAADAGAAAFAVTSRPGGGATFTITLPASIVLAGTHGGSMVVDGFTSVPSGVGYLYSGSTTLSVGATLHVGPNQTPASYSGTFEVIVTLSE